MSGVTPNGFEIKPLTTIQGEINAALVAAIGAGFDTSLDTPQGQISAVISDSMSSLWELMQDVYSSIDVHQAQGSRLDQLGELRRIARKTNENDNAYRARLLAPNNQTQSAVALLSAAISEVPGVTNVDIYYNATGVENRRGQQALTATIVVQGGDDIAVGQAIANNLVFGLGLLGNTLQNIDDNGVCRTIRFTRPEIINVTVDLVTNAALSIGQCGGSTTSSIKAILLNIFSDTYSNPGILISAEYLKAVLLCNGTGIQNLFINGDKLELQLTSGQIAALSVDNINVTVGG